MIGITRAHTAEHFHAMETFGRLVIPDVYTPFFAREWADYLVESGHTVSALMAQAAEGYRHYRVMMDDVMVGYFALHERADGVMVLSHLYLRPEYRSQGLGERVMEFVHREAAEHAVPAIELWVLRKSTRAVSFYQRHGYAIHREVLTPMGPGMLEDYVMRKEMNES